jgi:beta-galactosidase/beta-glucuronidase
MKINTEILSILSLLGLAACSGQKDAYVWAPAGDRIMTEWAETIDPSAVHQEYPRPQMVRSDWKNLNGLWDYAIVSEDDDPQGTACLTEDAQGKILVPFCVESALSGVGRFPSPDSLLLYRTEFKLPKWKGDRILLHFGAVDQDAEIYVNGQYAGGHQGGYDPFSIDVTPYLKSGKNELAVRVEDPTDSANRPRGKQVLEPGGIWYTPVTGIWQTVWMEPVPENHITGYHCVADIEQGTLTVFADIAGKGTVTAELMEGSTSFTSGSEGNVLTSVSEEVGTPIVLTVPQAQLWSPDSPYLYGLRLTLSEDGRTVDTVLGYAAMREISAIRTQDGHKRLALNGKPLFQFGPLDQGWWPDGLYTAPSDEALVYDIQKTKNFGFNMIRKHIKVEPARWYYHCDRLGMMVWQDMPSITDSRTNSWETQKYGGTDSQLTADEKANYRREWKNIMESLRIFPSIVVWVPFNEAWGQFDTEEITAYTREIDDSRLINPASGGNFRLCGDILDLHHYSEPGMVLYNKDYVNVLGEYGGIGLVVDGHIWQPDRNWGYVRYQSGEEVLKVYGDYAEMLKGLIAKGFSAAVYTQTTDVEIEVNGLMTYDRKVKVDEAGLRAINRSVIESMPAE